ncbi:ABC-F family ATP-binding cassette domain-containing protein [Paenacidovorax monticola]|uniref:ABC-F family ATP-binding cassette domain-containing protein n=1 Tax=Paenacidovorax monticola TaxID=1926868 RepID=A0A7H0HFL3_9BURK|nr:ABC-F family ATP-binding cassette domain-containing protein [Paenacidovorax monticola]QNP59329.1 ABC-F family ATP-binding cassette domain-containing protein [Paenacidovorax monticola]
MAQKLPAARAVSERGGLAASSSSFLLRFNRVAWLRPDGSPLWAEPLSAAFGPGVHALVGANGVGKSLLLALAARRVAPASGAVDGAGALFTVDQQVTVPHGMCVAGLAGVAGAMRALARLASGEGMADDLAAADGHWDLPMRWQAAMAGLGLGGLAPEHDAARLSGGERMRVALAGAFLSGADGLLLDEPTNHLDRAGRRWLRDQLAGWRGGVLMASHDRELLESVDGIAELGPRGLRLHGGGWALYAAQREAEALAAETALAHARAERERGLRALRDQHDALQRRAARGREAGHSTNQASILLDRRKEGAERYAGRERERLQAARAQWDAAVREAAGRMNPVPAVALALPQSCVPPAKPVLTFEALVPPHAGAGQPPLSGQWSGPVRIAVTGPNGCGKSTLLRLIAGSTAPADGRVVRGVCAAWLDQQGGALPAPESSVLQALRDLGSPLPESELRTRLAQLGLPAPRVLCPARELSGGERIKAALACALWGGQPAQMLLLDEPTNHLDLASVEALQAALRGFTGALVVASHDAHFLRALAPQVAWRWTPGGWDLDATLQG